MDLELFFIVRKMLDRLSKFLTWSGSSFHNFTCKTFWTETCFNRFYSRYNEDLTHSVRKLALKSKISWYLVHFSVSFMFMLFFVNVLFNWAVKKRIYEIFGFNAITKIHFWFFLQSFNFNFDIYTSVGSWLDKIAYLLLLVPWNDC